VYHIVYNLYCNLILHFGINVQQLSLSAHVLVDPAESLVVPLWATATILGNTILCTLTFITYGSFI